MGARSAYSAEQVAGLLGVSLTQLRGYVRSGVVEPERGPAGALRFSFQDLAFLRVVKELGSKGAGERVPPRRVRQAIRGLRQRLPKERPLSAVRLDAHGKQLVVREDDRVWSPESGQYWLQFERDSDSAPAVPLPPRETLAEQDVATADAWWVLGNDLEQSDPAGARRAYERALALDPEHVDAHVNLGCLEHEAGRLDAAERHYRAALARRPDDATAAFDLGVVLEDQGHLEEARVAYEDALRSDPILIDAHYNLARVCDRLGDGAAALRYLKSYRQLIER